MIEYIAYAILGFASLRFLIAFLNALFLETLPKKAHIKDSDKGKVSILIPARNEAGNIPNLLSDLRNLNDESICEIIVFDDQSEDDTANIVSQYCLQDPRLRLISSTSLPAGWVGKNHGCSSLASEAKGDFFLFLDADVRVQPGFVDRAVAYCQKKKVDLFTVFPTQEMNTWSERISVPNMHVILLTLLFLPLVRLSGFTSLSAANGQCMLFRRKVYKALLPHYTYRHSKAEDIEIARYLKRNRYKVACLTGIKSIHCHMYNDLQEALNGFSKNVTYFFGNSDSYFTATLFWAITTFGIVPLLLSSSPIFALYYIGLVILTRLMVSLSAKQPPLFNILLIIPQQIMLGAFILKSWLNKRRKQFEWKGRNV
ncbi:MAG: glycosyltransferase family 2 protein [Porphyromonas sp.]|nr:glycosyltransferase family 2 protein [Porphyromonas sp.]